MQALHDDKQIGVLEQKIDDGFAEMRAEFMAVRREFQGEIKNSERALRGEIIAVRSEVIAVGSDSHSDFRTLIAVVIALWIATILAMVGVIVSHV